MPQKTEPHTGIPVPMQKTDMELYADSRDIARGLGLQHDNVLQILDAPATIFGDGFGPVQFQIGPSADAQSTRTERFAYLTDLQVTCFATLARNTDESVDFKAALVKAFVGWHHALANSLPPLTRREVAEQAEAAKNRAISAARKSGWANEKASRRSRRGLTKRRATRRRSKD